MSPLLNSPLLIGGELAYGFVQRIIYRGSSLKFTTFFSSNSRYSHRQARFDIPAADLVFQIVGNGRNDTHLLDIRSVAVTVADSESTLAGSLDLSEAAP